MVKHQSDRGARVHDTGDQDDVPVTDEQSGDEGIDDQPMLDKRGDETAPPPLFPPEEE